MTNSSISDNLKFDDIVDKNSTEEDECEKIFDSEGNLIGYKDVGEKIYDAEGNFVGFRDDDMEDCSSYCSSTLGDKNR